MAGITVDTGDLNVSDYESITVADSAIGFTAAKIQAAKVKGVFCTVETAQIRFRMDGTSPTSAEGHVLDPGQTLTIINQGTLANTEFIRTGSTSGVLKVTYLKES